jgi:hypothetical protein
VLQGPVEPGQCISIYHEDNGVFSGWVETDPYYPFAKVPTYGGAAPTVSGEGTVEQWVYAAPDSSFITDYGQSNGQFPPEPLLQGMFQATNTYAGQAMPLFDLLQFPLEAYDNATQSTMSVTHVALSGGPYSSSYICKVTP